MKFAISATLGLALAAGVASGAIAQTEIQWWHAMAGANNEVVDALAKEFNESQSDYKVTPVFKGTYPEALQAGIAAFRAGQPPHILQVFDVGTGVMMGAEGAVMPVAEVIEKGGATFDKSQYLPGIVAYYSKPDGTMLSFPYNSSSPITYINKDVYTKAGLDPNVPPETWPQVWEHARKIVTRRAAPCGYTSGVAHLDSPRELRRLEQPPVCDQGERAWPDGRRASDQFANIREALRRLPTSPRRRFSDTADGTSEPSSSSFRRVRNLSRARRGPGRHREVRHELRYRPAPLRARSQRRTAEHHSRRASLWVFAGHEDEEYKGVSAFFQFLSQTEIQSRLHQVSGYLPATMAAYEATKQSGFYEKNPGREQPILQMTGKEPTENSRGVRLVNLPQVRDIQNEEFEAMLNGQQSAQEALDKAVQRGNEAIKQALGQ
jgi:sn-glycerol 3-phosphate transport system substrate-binding protein